MAITLDTIVNKVFKVVKNGYDNNEVEAFLDEILEEMENREAQTAQLQEQIAKLNRELEQARAQLAARPTAAPVSLAKEERHSTESFELVLSKAKGAYEEIVAAADARAEEIIRTANLEAANIRSSAESQITDLTEKLTALRKQSADYYTSIKKAMETQNASLEMIKNLL